MTTNTNDANPNTDVYEGLRHSEDHCSHHMFGPKTIAQIDAIQDRHLGKKIGFTASCFDLLHTGHLIMLREATKHCDVMVVALQTDPTIDRPHSKNAPIQSLEERQIMIEGIRYIDEVIIYATESDLRNILKHLDPDVRILGSDWKGKPYTGHEMLIRIHWHSRTHNYSTSNLRKRIHTAEQNKLAHELAHELDE